MSRMLILGTWGLSGAFGERSTNETRELLSAAYDAGITTIDTATVYGGGAVESLLSEFPKFMVATKIPAYPKPVPGEISQINQHYQEHVIVAQVEDILRRLGREAIDILQLHNWHESWQPEEILDIFAKLKQSGKVIRSGVSLPSDFNHSLPRGFDIVQLPLNLLETWALQYLRAEQTSAIWIRSILAHGALTERIGQPLSPNDVRASKFAEAQKRIAHLQSDAANGKMRTMKERALAFVKDAPNIDGIIIGCSTRNQLHELVHRLQ